MNEIQRNIEFLEKNGAESVEYIDDSYYFLFEDVSYRTEDVYGQEILQTANGLAMSFTIKNADLISCCGDVVDQDISRCPTCLENI